MRDFLIDRVSKAIDKNLNITEGSVPIPFFGDYEKAKSGTSDNEFHKKKGGRFVSYRNRLISRNDLNIKDEDTISESNCNIILKSCLKYFNHDPYKSWFDRYDVFLKCFDISYYNGSVVHLDIVQWATSPVWRGLSNEIKDSLIKQDLPFLKKILEDKKFEYIFLNGRTTVDSIKSFLNIEFEVEKTVLFNNRNLTLYYGKYANSKVIGWSNYLQSAQVGGYEKIRHLAKVIKTELKID